MNKKLRAKFRAQETAYGLWVTLESPSIVELAVELHLDWICIDLEHGYLSYEHVANHLRAAIGSDLSVLVRVPTHALEPAKRVLDLGAHGIVLPLVRNADEVRMIQQHAFFPPLGVRGLGFERSVRWGFGLDDYVNRANDDIMVIPVIETKDAVEAFDDIIDLDRVETVMLGPGDLSSSYGHIGQWEGPGIAEIVLELVQRATARGVTSGVLARDTDDALARRDQGFGMLGLGSDTSLMVSHISDMSRALNLQAGE